MPHISDSDSLKRFTILGTDFRVWLSLWWVILVFSAKVSGKLDSSEDKTVLFFVLSETCSNSFLALFFLYSPYHHLIFYLLILLIFFLVIKYKFQEFFCLVCCYISKTFPGIELALKKLVEWLMNHWMKFFLKSISL